MIAVTLGLLGISLTLSVIGKFLFWEKQVLLVEPFAHSLLPATSISLLLFPFVNSLTVFCTASCLVALGLYLIDSIDRYTKLERQTALVICTLFFWGLGLVLIGILQKNASQGHAIMKTFLVGHVGALLLSDLISSIFCIIMISGVMFFFFRPFILLIFDPLYGFFLDWPIGFFRIVWYIVLMIILIISVQAVGVVLITGIMVAPSITSTYWDHRMLHQFLWGFLFSTISISLGSYFSYKLPNLSTGAAIMIIYYIIFLLSCLLGSKKGFIQRLWREYSYKKRVIEENILKFLYLKRNKTNYGYNLIDLQKQINIGLKSIKSGVLRLKKKKMIYQKDQFYSCSAKGLEVGKKIYDKHILWEKYLRHNMKIDSNLLHDSAEIMEHLMNERIVNILVEDLEK